MSDTNNLEKLFHDVGLTSLDSKKVDVLGEKALAEGHIDIIIKEAVPIGIARKIVIEVKTGLAKLKDIEQLKSYMDELGDECISGILIAKDFSKKLLLEAMNKKVHTFSYHLKILEKQEPVTFIELKSDLKLVKTI